MKKEDLLKTVQEALATGRAECIVLMLHMPGGDVDIVQSSNLEAKAKYIDIAFDDDLVCIDNPCIFVENFGIAYQNSLMDFGAALMNLKEGKRVARMGWNGKGMFLYYVPAAAYPPCTEVAKAAFSGNDVPYGAYIAMKTAQDNVVPWLASQSDMLADDWYVVAD